VSTSTSENKCPCELRSSLLDYCWSRLWWNWQTRYFEVVVGQPVQVQVLLCAPIFSGGMTSQRRPAKSDCCRLIRSSQIPPTPENHTFWKTWKSGFGAWSLS